MRTPVSALNPTNRLFVVGMKPLSERDENIITGVFPVLTLNPSRNEATL